jgi:hypothetical protein
VNIKIHLNKTTDSDVVIAVDMQQHLLTKAETIISIDRNIQQSYYLELSRCNTSLYVTPKLVHDTYVIVDKIVIDNFWVIGEHNHWSETIFNADYIDHLSNKRVTWELDKKLYNNVLYFNGLLRYKITTPVRGMFFK